MGFLMDLFSGAVDAALRYRTVSRNSRWMTLPGVHPSVVFLGDGDVKIADSEYLVVGEKTVIVTGGVHLECRAGIQIGVHCKLASGLVIYTYNHVYDGNEIPYESPGNDILKKVVIEDYVWICADVHICPGVRIGEGAVIGMGAVVTKDIPPLAVAGGCPAKVIKYRDKDKYYANKTAGRIR
jgi:acetyltransferase-like isoleucine patch superfamily enzyme